MNGKEADEVSRAIPYPRNAKKAERPALMEAYREAQDAVREDFRKSLAETHGAYFPDALKENLWRRAWSDGHHAGFELVEQYYIDYVEFAEQVIDAVR